MLESSASGNLVPGLVDTSKLCVASRGSSLTRVHGWQDWKKEHLLFHPAFVPAAFPDLRVGHCPNELDAIHPTR
eukprot:38753-Prorocentrum_lima.AAC.1